VKVHANYLRQVQSYRVNLIERQPLNNDSVDLRLRNLEATLGLLPLEFVVKSKWSLKDKDVYLLNRQHAGIDLLDSQARLIVSRSIQNSNLNILIQNAQPTQYASPFPTISSDLAVAQTLKDPSLRDYKLVSSAKLKYFLGAKATSIARLCWEFEIQSFEISPTSVLQRYAIYIDAHTGIKLEQKNQTFNLDTTYPDTIYGQVSAWVTPGTTSDTPQNPPSFESFGGSLIYMNGLPQNYSREDGSYEFAFNGSNELFLSSTLNSDTFEVIDYPSLGDSNLIATREFDVNIDAPPFNLIFNETPLETNTSQVNTFKWLLKSRKFAKSYLPELGGLDDQTFGVVNIDEITCNAFYSGSFAFVKSSANCVNSAYSTVISHEYAHHIVKSLGLAQGAFGEGYSDSFAMLLHDTEVVGEDFYWDGRDIRWPYRSGVRYPCVGEIHHCGQALGGFWWSLRLKLGAKYYEPFGLERSYLLFMNWTAITLGGYMSNGLLPDTITEVLIADDNDGNIVNGTPNSPLICQAANEFGLPCPKFIMMGKSKP